MNGMKYWGFFLAKLLAVAGTSVGLGWLLYVFFPRQPIAFGLRDPFMQLPFTLMAMAHFVLTMGMIWVAVWDQKMRCRTCLRRLRMPVAEGHWHHVLLGPPRTSYVCVFGHGTLRVSELNITGKNPAAWEEHEDIWTELYELESSER